MNILKELLQISILPRLESVFSVKAMYIVHIMVIIRSIGNLILILYRIRVIKIIKDALEEKYMAVAASKMVNIVKLVFFKTFPSFNGRLRDKKQIISDI